MSAMTKFLRGAVLSGVFFLLGGCFQAQLNGSISGASITLSDIRINAPIPAATFEFDKPRGVQVLTP